MFLGNLTEEQRLSKAVVKIMDKAPYLSAVLMIGRREITDNPKTRTAYTNGKDEFYSRTFVASLNDAELRFLVLHEVYHKLFKHLTTWKHLWEKDADRTNRAADHVINIKIVDEFSQDGFYFEQGDPLLDLFRSACRHHAVREGARRARLCVQAGDLHKGRRAHPAG